MPEAIEWIARDTCLRGSTMPLRVSVLVNTIDLLPTEAEAVVGWH